ncbi:MAG TPA: tetratricopeptide repeat protein [Kofleriaceae bacterium]|jgi:tetratricopeptide (TPR) repeat protein|nr:tetratricopeptide repeat protein [Kofleriaceae bacterium]
MLVFIGRSRWLVAALVAVGSATGSTVGVARADDVDARLAGYEGEARALGDHLPRPGQILGASGQRRLLDAEVAYSLGDYAAAALMLFELATKPGADQETARFYLAESLFQKGDRGAARGYYEQVVANNNVASNYYQPALERLIEIAIVEKDDTNVGQHIAALDRVPPGLRRPSVPYIRGKLAYSQGKYDEAIAYFQAVPKGSAYELLAAYYLATTYVVNKDVQRAIDILTDLVGKKPRTANDRRVVELSQLALGRLYYERDQPSKSIDSYLLVDRHSELFPDALYEVAWVYVKSKQYDKALRALELLALSDPGSTKTPIVRILEGNLRIRKAQIVRGAQILGTLDEEPKDDPAAEYDRAVQVFTETHDMYLPSYAALAQMVDSDADPAQYLAQIAGRSEHVFQAVAAIPEAAIQYLRDEPEVQRVVAVETDLGDITTNLAQTEATIARLEGVLAAEDKSAVYPALASRRARIAEIADDVIKIRSDLAEKALRLIDGSGELAPLSARRRQLFASYAAMPNAERAAADHLARRQAQYDQIEHAAAEVDGAVGATLAVAVALRTYASDTRGLPAEQKKTEGGRSSAGEGPGAPLARAHPGGKAVIGALDEASREAQAIEDELDGVRKEIQIGRDLAAIGDEAGPASGAARTARDELKAAEDAEYKVLTGLANGSRGKAQPLVSLGDRAARLAETLEETDHVVASLVEQGLQEVRVTLAKEKATLDACKAELGDYEAETRALGGSVLAASEQIVKGKLYDIVIRTDVGNVDVRWSQKEDTDDDLKRLNLSRQRDLKQLKDEFKDILEGGAPSPPVPAAKLEMPRPASDQTSGNPDRGDSGQRIPPASAPASPEVQPDNAANKVDSKKADPPKTDSKKAEPKNADARKGGAR